METCICPESTSPCTVRSSSSSLDLEVGQSARDVPPEGLGELLRTVQGLVDSGQVQVSMMDGRVSFRVPRPLDEADPYTPVASR